MGPPQMATIVGFCSEREEQMLVYEYIRNGTLKDAFKCTHTYIYIYICSLILTVHIILVWNTLLHYIHLLVGSIGCGCR